MIRPLPTALVLAVAATLFGGCDQVETPSPFSAAEAPLSVYGVLREERPEQQVRVELRRRSVDFPQTPGEALLEGVSVFSQLVGEEPGPIIPWRQAPSQLEDGSYASVFSRRAPFTRGNTYAITARYVSEGDTVETRYEVLVPTPGAVIYSQIVPADTVRAVFEWRQNQPSRFDRASVEHAVCLFNSGATPVGPIRLSRPPQITETDRGLVLSDRLDDLRQLLIDRYDLEEDALLRYDAATLRMTVRDPSWEDGSGVVGGDVIGQSAGFIGASASLEDAAFPVFGDLPPFAPYPLSRVGFAELPDVPCE